MIEIPSIVERQHRKCNTCIWYRITNGFDYCLAKTELHYTLMSERSDLFDTTNFEDLQNMPCRLHMTLDELRMILDPYFME